MHYFYSICWYYYLKLKINNGFILDNTIKIVFMNYEKLRNICDVIYYNKIE